MLRDNYVNDNQIAMETMDKVCSADFPRPLTNACGVE